MRGGGNGLFHVQLIDNLNDYVTLWHYLRLILQNLKNTHRRGSSFSLGWASDQKLYCSNTCLFTLVQCKFYFLTRIGFSAQRDLALAKYKKKWSHVILCISWLSHCPRCSTPRPLYVQLIIFMATRFLLSRLKLRQSFSICSSCNLISLCILLQVILFQVSLSEQIISILKYY